MCLHNSVGCAPEAGWHEPGCWVQVVEVKAAIDGIADGVHGARRIPGKVSPGAVPLRALG